jgi:hypothetical protein
MVLTISSRRWEFKQEHDPPATLSHLLKVCVIEIWMTTSGKNGLFKSVAGCAPGLEGRVKILNWFPLQTEAIFPWGGGAPQLSKDTLINVTLLCSI